MGGNPRVLGAAPEGDDHVALDVAEGAFALAVGIPRRRSRPLTAPTRDTREPPDRRVGTDRSAEGADPLGADVV